MYTQNRKYQNTYKGFTYQLTEIGNFTSSVVTAIIDINEQILKNIQQKADYWDEKFTIPFANGDILKCQIYDFEGDLTIYFDNNNFNIPEKYRSKRYIDYKCKVVIDHLINEYSNDLTDNNKAPKIPVSL